VTRDFFQSLQRELDEGFVQKIRHNRNACGIHACVYKYSWKKGKGTKGLRYSARDKRSLHWCNIVTASAFRDAFFW